ncbi:MAG: hypothetical protein MHM6MM_006947 [Cercozoa sp. M6MM]
MSTGPLVRNAVSALSGVPRLVVSPASLFNATVNVKLSELPSSVRVRNPLSTWSLGKEVNPIQRFQWKASVVSPRMRRTQKLLKYAKGYRGRAKNCIRIARHTVEKAWTKAYRGRKLKKRHFRRLQIQRINAAANEHGLRYSDFVHAAHMDNVVLDRKMLSTLAMEEPLTFRALCEHLGGKINYKSPKKYLM